MAMSRVGEGEKGGRRREEGEGGGGYFNMEKGE